MDKWKWPEDRIDELHKMLDILFSLEHINSGSGFIQKIDELVKDAKSLNRSDLRNNRESFAQFLISKAHE